MSVLTHRHNKTGIADTYILSNDSSLIPRRCQCSEKNCYELEKCERWIIFI